MNQRPLKSLGLTVVALCWFMSCHLSSAVAQTREAKPPISPMQGYLIWTKVQKPDTEGLTLFAPEHIFLNGRFRVGRVQIQVERFSEGFFVADAAADTERIIRKMAEQIVKMQNIDKAEDVLLKVQDVGEEWFFPWNRPKKFFGFEIAEATWRDGNLKDPRGFNGLLALGMSSVSEEAAKKRKKEFEEALAAAKKDPKLGAVYSNLTGADMLQNLEDYGFASRNVTIARLQGMGSGSKWAANEYNRSRANGKKSPILENLKKIRADALEKFKTYEQNNQQVPEDQKIGFAMLEKEIARHMEAVEHDDDRLTIHVFVLAGKAPVQVSEDIVKKAVEIATEMKTIGLDYQNALDLKDWESGEFKKERDTLADTIAKIKAMNNEPSEFQIKQLAEMDKRLANEKKRLDTKVKFKTEYKYFAGEDDEDYWIWLPKFGEMRKKFDNRLVEIKADLKEMATERKHLYKQQQSLMQVEHFYMSKDIQETSPEKTINLADSKKLKNFIAQRSNELHGSDGPSPEPESQAGLIKEAEKSLKELADSSRQQWEKVKNNPASTLSEDNKKDLEKTARFWEDREKIVRLELYEAADWNKPRELRALAEDLKLSDADPELVLLMDAKIRIAEADFLENLVFLDGVSFPIYDVPPQPAAPKPVLLPEGPTTPTRNVFPPRSLAKQPVVSWTSQPRPQLQPLPLPMPAPLPAPLPEPTPPKKVVTPELKARQARIEAVAFLHQALKQFPNNREMRVLLIQQEYVILNWIAVKLESEKQVSRDAFEKFFVSRGWNPNITTGFWDGLGERLKILFFYLPSNRYQAAIDGADEIADATMLMQMEAASMHISLLVMKRLTRLRHFTMEEIRAIKPSELSEKMAFKTIGGEQLPPKRSEVLGTDMKLAFDRLKELNALADGNAKDLLAALDSPNYSVFDADRSWAEAITDFAFFPPTWIFPAARGVYVVSEGTASVLATTRVWKYFKAAADPRLAALADKTRPLRDLVAGSNLAKLTMRGAGKSSEMITNWIRRDIDMFRGFGPVRKFVNIQGRSLLLFSGLMAMDEKFDLPAMKCLAMLSLTMNVEMMHQAFAVSGMATAEMLANVDLLATTANAQKVTADALQRKLVEADRHIIALGKAKTAEERQALIEKIRKLSLLLVEHEPSSINNIPVTELVPARGLDAFADYAHVIKEMLKYIDEGNLVHAERCRIAAEAFLISMRSTIEDVVKGAAVLKGVLSQYSPAPAPISEAIKFLEVSKLKPESLFLEDLYKINVVGPKLFKGDELLKRGDWEGARSFYQKALGAAQLNGDVRLMDVLVRRGVLTSITEDLVASNLKNQKKTAELLANLAKEIEEKDFEFILNEVEFKSDDGNRFFIGSVTDAVRYFFKRYNPEREDVALCKLNESLAPGLMKFFGAPSVWSKSGKAKLVVSGTTSFPGAEGLISRFVNGKQALEMTQPELLAFKKEFAMYRVLNVLLGNPDTHMGNFILSEGCLIPIDFGNARFNSSLAHQLGSATNVNKGRATSQAEYLEWMLNFVNERAADPNSHKAYKWAAQLDEFLDYADMEPMIKHIEYLCENKETELLEVLKKGYALRGERIIDTQVQITLDTLKERAKLLRKVFQKKFSTTKWFVAN